MPPVLPAGHGGLNCRITQFRAAVGTCVRGWSSIVPVRLRPPEHAAWPEARPHGIEPLNLVNLLFALHEDRQRHIYCPFAQLRVQAAPAARQAPAAPARGPPRPCGTPWASAARLGRGAPQLAPQTGADAIVEIHANARQCPQVDTFHEKNQGAGCGAPKPAQSRSRVQTC